MRTAAPWLVLGAATAAASFALGAVGLPSPTLFAALLVGLAAALLTPRSGLKLPNSSFIAAQAVCGVTLGAYLESDSLEAIAGSWLPVAAGQRGHARAQHRRRLGARPHHRARPPDGHARDDRRRRVRDRRHGQGPRRRRSARRLHAVPARADRRPRDAAAGDDLRRRRGDRRGAERGPAGDAARLADHRRRRAARRAARPPRADPRRHAARPDGRRRRADAVRASASSCPRSCASSRSR